MKIALNETRQGLSRATSQVHLATSRIARWGLSNDTTGDTVALNGAERPRNVLNQKWGKGPDGLSPDIDLSEEAIRLKNGEWAFKANIAATRSVLDMERKALDIMDQSNQDD